MPTQTSISEPTNLRVLQINLNYQNAKYDDVLRCVSSTSPDVVLLTEVTPAWNELLNTKMDQYQFRLAEPRSDTFGIALFSRVPMEGKVTFIGADLPNIVATITKDGQKLCVLGLHLMGPPTPPGYALQQKQFEALSRAKFPSPLLVAGDFNCAPWTTPFKNFVDAHHLIDTRIGRGFDLSWPSAEPIIVFPNGFVCKPPFGILAAPMKLPIDHFLVSRQLRVKSQSIGGYVGSDHLPFVIDLVFAAAR